MTVLSKRSATALFFVYFSVIIHNELIKAIKNILIKCKIKFVNKHKFKKIKLLRDFKIDQSFFMNRILKPKKKRQRFNPFNFMLIRLIL